MLVTATSFVISANLDDQEALKCIPTSNLGAFNCPNLLNISTGMTIACLQEHFKVAFFQNQKTCHFSVEFKPEPPVYTYMHADNPSNNYACSILVGCPTYIPQTNNYLTLM